MGDGIAILTTAPHQSRNGDVQFQFRPDSDFYYLTHFPEPGGRHGACSREAGGRIYFVLPP